MPGALALPCGSVAPPPFPLSPRHTRWGRVSMAGIRTRNRPTHERTVRPLCQNRLERKLRLFVYLYIIRSVYQTQSFIRFQKINFLKHKVQKTEKLFFGKIQFQSGTNTHPSSFEATRTECHNVFIANPYIPKSVCHSLCKADREISVSS